MLFNFYPLLIFGHKKSSFKDGNTRAHRFDGLPIFHRYTPRSSTQVSLQVKGGFSLVSVFVSPRAIAESSCSSVSICVPQEAERKGKKAMHHSQRRCVLIM